jgi:hypothetical protein
MAGMLIGVVRLMFHFRAPGRYLNQQSPALNWGPFTTYIEVDDQKATRQVCVFKNGNVLRYDADMSRDEFAYLCGLRFSRKPKWRDYFPGAELISSREFESIWQRE